MTTELIGIAGGLCFLVGFFQVSVGKWNGRSFYYEASNLVGAVLLGWYAFDKHAYTNIALNLIWGTVALYAISNIYQRHILRKKNKRKTKRAK